MVSPQHSQANLSSLTTGLTRLTHRQASKGAKADIQTMTDPHLPPNDKTAMDKQPHSNASQFFRRLSTRLRPPATRRSVLLPHGTGLPNYLVAKGNREAALRACGLIPPKDLSEQEREWDMDQQAGPDTATTTTTTDGASPETAAKKIKAEWEANNRSRDADQSDKFRPCATQLVAAEKSSEAEMTLWLEYVSKEPTPSPSEVNLPQSPSQDVTPTPHTPPPPSPTKEHLGTATRVLPNLNLSHMRSLPSLNTADLPCSIALPPSPVSSASNDACSESPFSSAISQTLSPPLLLVTPTRTRAKSAPTLPSLCESASLAPSSITTPSSPVDPSCPPEISGITPPRKDVLRQALGVKIRTPHEYDGNENIPMIAESPVEEVMVIPDILPTNDVEDAMPSSTIGFRTSPVVMNERSSFFGLKKDSGPRISAPKRSYSSIANLRSAIGSLRRSKTAGTLPTPNVSHPPRSPTLPTSFALGSSRSRTGLDQDARLEASQRQPVSPTIHSLGSILLNTRDIEDEESRRLSEMAFLD